MLRKSFKSKSKKKMLKISENVCTLRCQFVGIDIDKTCRKLAKEPPRHTITKESDILMHSTIAPEDALGI